MGYNIRQGYVRQGREEERIVTVEGVAHKINQYINLFDHVLFGTITLEPDAIYQYGTLRHIQLNPNKTEWTFVFSHVETNEETKISFPFSAISLTHDVEFTVDDNEKGRVPYPVFFMTVSGTTYYIGSTSIVSHALECIAEFYLRSHKVGENMELPDQRACSWSPPSR